MKPPQGASSAFADTYGLVYAASNNKNHREKIRR